MTKEESSARRCATRIIGKFGRERLEVRRFRDRSAMHEFLNRQRRNEWIPILLEWDKWDENTRKRPTKPGTYASVAGKWVDIRTLDEVTLAHV